MEADKNSILKRLRRIEGQVKGIQRMVEREEQCSEILIQVAAVRAAINKVGGLILENYSRNCLGKADQVQENDKKLEELIETIIKFTK